MPSLGTRPGFAAKRVLKLDLKMWLCAGLPGSDASLARYCSDNFCRRSSAGGSPASTCRLGIGDVLHDPRQTRRAAF